MTCQECARLLLDYHFDTLDPFQRSLVEQHLRECPACRATLERLGTSVPDQLSWPDEELPPGLAEKVNAKLREEQPRDDWAQEAEREPVAKVVPLRKPASDADPAKKEASPSRALLKIAAAIGIVSFGLWGWSVNQRRVSLVAALDGQQELAPGTLSTLRMSVFDVQTQEPIAGASLKVLLRGPDGRETVVFEGPSDRYGTLSAGRALPDLPEGGYTLVATATSGRESTTVTEKVTLARRYKVLLSTDKPTYQPGQTLHVRALAREATANRPPEGQELSFTVVDAKGNKVGRKLAKVDRFGVASFDFPLADEILLGTWKVQAALAGVTSDVDVTVARYSLPKFEVKLTSEKPWYKPGEVVSGRVESRYFFGKPVKNAKVKVTAGVFIDRFRTVAEAAGTADDSGVFGFELALPKALPGLALTQGSAAVDLKLEIQDQAGEKVEKHQGLMVAEESMTITAVPEGGVLVPGVQNRVLVLAVRPDGEPVAGAKVSFPMAEGAPSAVTGEDGLAAVSFTPTSQRRDLVVRVEAKDGATLTRSVEVTSEALPGVIHTERTLYSAGETVRGEILATSPAGAAFLDVVRDGRTIFTTTVPLVSGKGSFAVDLPAESAGTVTLYAYTPGRDTKRSRKTLFVGEPRALTVAVSADAETFRPGKEAKLTFKVAGEDGKPASASIGVAVVDESVFALAAQEPALLKAYFLLAEELSKPRYELDPARVVADPKRDLAASLLFSQPRESEVRRVGATGEQELPGPPLLSDRPPDQGHADELGLRPRLPWRHLRGRAPIPFREDLRPVPEGQVVALGRIAPRRGSGPVGQSRRG
ncbi:MAG: MG2 domain-containing protein [Myxococcales bacterium]